MKITSLSFSLKAARLFCTLLCTAALASSLSAKPVPSNIDGGLEKLVESNLALKAAAAKGQANFVGQYNGYATEEAASYAAVAVTESDTGRLMVDVTVRGRGDFAKTLTKVTSRIPSFTVVATDAQYRGAGMIEGWISVDDVPALANIAGVRAVFLSIKPELDSLNPIDPTVFMPSRSVKSLRDVANNGAPTPNVVPGDVLKRLGTTFDQGVSQHRVDKINQFYNPSATVNWDGAGISVGALSDSFNTRAAAPHADTGVANFDLPGSASHPLNSQPVVVLQDSPGGTDEGRGMIEIIHKMAPRARLAFATGGGGNVAFGNNIRALAGLPGFTYPAGTQQGFKADVIVDDLSIVGEPFYGESIVGNAIDDVAAAGVAYFSSAGNNIGTNGYESALRLVANGSGTTAATNAALVGTNIDLAGVPPELYGGGFHNFNPNPGQQDVAALWNIPNSTTAQTEMQWDDPFDPSDPPLDQPPFYQNTGTITAANASTGVTFTDIPNFTAAKSYFIEVLNTAGDFDAIVSVIDPSGNTIVSQDTGTDEQLLVGPQTTGNYKVKVDRFAPTLGSFSIKINTANAGETVTTDLNLLIFRADNGAYFGARSLYQNNIATNRPTEYGQVTSPAGGQCQFVIAKGVNSRPGIQPSRVRIQSRGNGAAGFGPAEYVLYNAPTSKGHATAAGGNGVAAYSPFRPNIPESFSSPGSAFIVFDKMGNRLPQPVVRLYPTVAAINRANTSFFGGDSTSDPDTNPEFSGTSAAAPHAAGLAALVLHAHGGPGTVTPTQMRSVLQRSAFPHDLDPNASSGVARASNGGKVILTIVSDNSTNLGQGSNDLNSFQVAYVGPGSIASLTFNPNGTAAEGGNVTGGNNGYQDNTPAAGQITYFANSYPGVVFLPTTRAFALGTLTGLTAADVTPPLSATPFTGFSNAAPPPANGTTQFRTMTINFPTGNFSGGKVVRFTVGRGAEHSSAVGNGAAFNPGATGGTVTQNPTGDVFGGGVFIPDGTVVQDGMRFSGTLTGGGTFTGVIRNRIGNGYSNLDGFGVINAESAVALPLQ